MFSFKHFSEKERERHITDKIASSRPPLSLMKKKNVARSRFEKWTLQIEHFRVSPARFSAMFPRVTARGHFSSVLESNGQSRRGKFRRSTFPIAPGRPERFASLASGYPGRTIYPVTAGDNRADLTNRHSPSPPRPSPRDISLRVLHSRPVCKRASGPGSLISHQR